jgi:hypothetical protein
MESETSWTAVIALVLAVIAIIFIIVVVFLFSVNSDIISARVDDWVLRESGTSGTVMTPESFVATPNTILNISPSIVAGYAVAINNYASISSIVGAQRTTIFKIANNRSLIPVTVKEGSGISLVAGVPSPTTVAPGTTATYMWVSATAVQRIE